MAKIKSREEYEAWKAKKLAQAEQDKDEQERRKDEQERLDREEQERRKDEQERLDREEQERRKVKRERLDREASIPRPEVTPLSTIFYWLSGLSLLVGFLLFAKTSNENIFPPFTWALFGVIDAALFAFLGKCLDYLNGIYFSTFK